jgi:membrane fusion protein
VTGSGPPRDARPRAPLFRPEAVAEQEDRWLGRVMLVPRLSHTIYTAAAALLVAGTIVLFGFGEYTQKARLSGWLAPERGLIEIVAPQGGSVAQVLVREGLEVEPGTPLAILSAERQSGALGATQGEVVRALQRRRESLIAERAQHEALFDEQAVAFEARLAVMANEEKDLAREFDLLQERLALAEAAAARQRDLRGRELVTDAALGEAEQTVLDRALALQSLERQRTSLARARIEVVAARDEAPLREALQLAEIDRALATLDQEIAEAEAQREIVVTAPSAGVVTAIRVTAGGGVAAAEPMMTLVPADATLEAHLYGPSRSIGFVRAGQRVLIRYEAYPHQRFGLYEGVVASVSRAPVAVPASGPTTGERGDAAAGEPVYRVTVALSSQTAVAYGDAAPLQPGMVLEADVLMETLRIYEWVLEPLYALSGRVSA